MKAEPGTRLGPYEIVSPLGAGGMGEVYRARDTRLGREVALKILPDAFASDPERLKRFERESRAASAISDPHVVAVFDVGQERGVHFFVCELVEGTNLRGAMDGGALPLVRVLDYAAQVASALASAHARGIVHRDLKPENILLTRSGFVKVADFGLAKFVETSADSSQSPTAELSATASGSIMGTVAYMSPEQARGSAVDFRSDQFSLGAILYEMASGRAAFKRGSAAETLSSILRDEPPALPETGTPELLRWVIARCLSKDPAGRYASTEDLARELQSLPSRLGAAAAPTGSSAPARRGPRFWPALAALLAVGGVAVLLSRRPRVPRAPVSFHDVTFSGHDSSPSASPDGKRIAFVSDRDGKSRIWIEQLAGGGEAPLTEGQDSFPRFSPDGEMLLFARFENDRTSLYRSAIVGGEPHRIIPDAVEGDWSPDGKTIAFLRWKAKGASTVFTIGTAGSDGSGMREIVELPNHPILHPRWSPDGRRIAATESANGGAPGSIFVISRDGRRVREILPPRRSGWISSVVWIAPDEIAYSIADSAVAATIGSSALVVRQNVDNSKWEPLFWSPANAQTMDLLAAGKIVFDVVSRRENLRETSSDGLGAATEARWLTKGSSSDRQPAYSRDGGWVIFSSNRSGNLDLWKVAPGTGALRQLTDDQADDWDPAFTPDGKRILWSSNRSGPFEIWMADADGTGARRVSNDGVDAENPTSTPDGQWVVYISQNSAKSGIWKVHPDGTGAARVVAGTSSIFYPEVSPDGTYVAYRQNVDPRRVEVRVARISDGSPAPFVAPLAIRKGYAATSVGRSRWMPDGRSLVFVGQDDRGASGLFRQDFDLARDTRGTLRPLGAFDPDVASESFGISPDGKRLTVGGWEQLSSIRIAENIHGVAGRRRPAP